MPHSYRSLVLTSALCVVGCSSAPDELDKELLEYVNRVKDLNREERAKLTALERQRRMRKALDDQSAPVRLNGVVVRVEEIRPAGLRQAFPSTNPITEKFTEDVRLDSAISVSFEVDGGELATFAGIETMRDLGKVLDALSGPPDATTVALLIDGLELALADLEGLREWIESKATLVARVEAYMAPQGAAGVERKRVHVENYDEITGGSSTVESNRRTIIRPAARMQALIALDEIASLMASIEAKEDVLPESLDWELPVVSLKERANDLQSLCADSQSRLPRARIELSRLGASHSDLLSVKVFIEQKGEVAITESEQWNCQLVQVGVYSKISGSLIFARADSGPGTAQDWKANAAASLEWHYRTIYADSWFDRAWNWLDPGVGVHLASLDQTDDESAELGIGVNASLWNGFLQGGVGYNLNVDRDHLYYYFGIDLLKVLTDAKERIGP